MSQRRALVISVQGLSPAALEPYGCSWLHTEALNRLAAQSLVSERCLADSLDPREVLCSLWTGTHAARRAARDAPWQQTSVAGIDPAEAILISDADEIFQSPLADVFANQITSADAATTDDALPEDIEDTLAGRLFAEAINAATDPEYRLVWVHATSLVRRWDAPAWLSPPDEIPLPETMQPPHGMNVTDIDPDELLAWMNLYGRQIRLFDMLIGVLVDAIDNSDLAEQTMLVLTGTQSMPLGERGELGIASDCDRSSPKLHLPLIVRTPNGQAVRSQRSCQAHEVAPAIEQWIGRSATQSPSGLLADASPAGWANSERATDWALTLDHAGTVCSFLTPYWNLLLDQAGEKLYRKPDDRFDVNDIASRAPDVVAMLQSHAQSARESIQQATPRCPLSAELLSGQW